MPIDGKSLDAFRDFRAELLQWHKPDQATGERRQAEHDFAVADATPDTLHDSVDKAIVGNHRDIVFEHRTDLGIAQLIRRIFFAVVRHCLSDHVCVF